MLQTGLQLVKNSFLAPIHFIVNLFRWLFDHNYYFHDLVVSIQTAFTNARQFIIHLWTEIKDWLGVQWKRIQAEVAAAWLLIQSYIVKPVEQAIATVQAKILEIRTWLLGKWEVVKTDAQAAWTRFTDLIGAAVSLARTKVQQVVAAILKPITDLGQTLFNAGKNLIQMLINGIESMASNVGNAAKNIAGKITSFLGFHSPAKEGPGATADQWMPNLVAMLAHGLQEAAPRLQVAADVAATSLALPFVAAPSHVPSAATNGVAANQPIVVNLVVDGRKLATAVVNHSGAAVRATTGQRGM